MYRKKHSRCLCWGQLCVVIKISATLCVWSAVSCNSLVTCTLTNTPLVTLVCAHQRPFGYARLCSPMHLVFSLSKRMGLLFLCCSACTGLISNSIALSLAGVLLAASNLGEGEEWRPILSSVFHLLTRTGAFLRFKSSPGCVIYPSPAQTGKPQLGAGM